MKTKKPTPQTAWRWQGWPGMSGHKQSKQPNKGNTMNKKRAWLKRHDTLLTIVMYVAAAMMVWLVWPL